MMDHLESLDGSNRYFNGSRRISCWQNIKELFCYVHGVYKTACIENNISGEERLNGCETIDKIFEDHKFTQSTKTIALKVASS